MVSPKKQAEKIFSLADIKINGNRPWDIQVHNEKLYARALAGGSKALGEAYMNGWWDCKALDQFFTKLLEAKIEEKLVTTDKLWILLKSVLFNMQNINKAFEVGEKHYDAGNDLYKKMLDKRMIYSCAYWKNAKTLDKAQENKLDLICKKIGLKKGMKVLDIGCGWGGFAKFAAEKYKVEVVGITISKEQAKFAREVCKGLPVEIRLQDYRSLNEKFDRVVSIGMFEHVGPKNYRTYMKIVSKLLNDGGLTLLHTIGRNEPRAHVDPWIEKYIFPNGVLPSTSQISRASEGLLIMEDWHNFGPDYDKTLIQWQKNFKKSWDSIKKNYDEKFYRMWIYYLSFAAASFRARKNQLWQVVFSKKGTKGTYKSVR